MTGQKLQKGSILMHYVRPQQMLLANDIGADKLRKCVNCAVSLNKGVTCQDVTPDPS